MYEYGTNDWADSLRETEDLSQEDDDTYRPRTNDEILGDMNNPDDDDEE